MKVKVNPISSILVLLALWMPLGATAVEQWDVYETSFESSEKHGNPFMDVQADVVFAIKGTEWKQPAFWSGGNTWTVRFAFPEIGTFSYRVESNDASLNGKKGIVEVEAYTGDNPLIKHGNLRISENNRYFEHADGTPFLWMGDTWWKCLSKRLSFDDFKELVDDRAKKGFTLAQIVCGPYPDEEFYTDWWDNEGGKPYLNREFTRINLEYFKYTDQRFAYMVKSGLVPAIVGAWGRHDCDAMKFIGTEGMKRHWRELIARYGAYPTVWIVGGEASGELWSETARYVNETDPFNRPVTVHGDPGMSVRESVGAHNVNFDFLQTGHGRTGEDQNAIDKLVASYNVEPHMPALISEHSYEQHMKGGESYTQRFVFWGSMLSGGAGLTYGAAGIWHAGLEGFPATVNTYDFTTWRQGMVYPGSTQMGLNANFLRQYPWEKFVVHPEWADENIFAAGIPGELRMLYTPRPPAYRWAGFKVHELEVDTPYKTFFFDPSTGRTFDYGIVKHVDKAEVVFQDNLSAGQKTLWKDAGRAPEFHDDDQEHQLVDEVGSLKILSKNIDSYVNVSAVVPSDADIGIVLNYTDKENFLVALYSASQKRVLFYDVKDGHYGKPLGAGPRALSRGPMTLRAKLAPKIRLTATLQNGVASLEIKSGKATFVTGTKIQHNTSGRVGLWLGPGSDASQFNLFKVVDVPDKKEGIEYLLTPSLNIERVPSPQDWVLVMERINKE